MLHIRTAAELNESLIVALRGAGHIRREHIAGAFEAVPRHVFVPGTPLDAAYRDDVVFTARDSQGRPVSSVSAPWLVAVMLERLDPQPGERILEIGSGGYNAALLRQLVGARGSVTSVDIDPQVIERAGQCLKGTPWDDVRLVTGDGEWGVPDGAPYDKIVVTVQAAGIAPAWLDQLRSDGRLVVPLRVRGMGRLLTFTSPDGIWTGGGWEQCGFVRMRGTGARQPVATTVLGEGVRLRADGEPRPDQEALSRAARDGMREVWTGVTVGVSEGTRPVLDVWLATVLEAFGRLFADAPEPTTGGSVRPLPGGSAATWSSDTLAYVTMRPVDAEQSRFEYGIAWHGPDEGLAEDMAEQVRVWDRDHRGGRGPMLMLHAEASSEAPTVGRVSPPAGRPVGRALNRTGPRMVLTW